MSFQIKMFCHQKALLARLRMWEEENCLSTMSLDLVVGNWLIESHDEHTVLYQSNGWHPPQGFYLFWDRLDCLSGVCGNHFMWRWWSTQSKWSQTCKKYKKKFFYGGYEMWPNFTNGKCNRKFGFTPSKNDYCNRTFDFTPKKIISTK